MSEQAAEELPGLEFNDARDDQIGHDHLGPALEALLLVADQPVLESTLAQLMDVPVPAIQQTLAELADFYAETGRGFELRPLAGGWRLYTRDEHADLIGRYLLEGQQAKLSQAALETLAVVAYLQPVSRARVSGVRGVSVDGVMRTLLTRELIAEVGVDEHSGATLFATTDYFLERMGLESLDGLPPLAPHLPDVNELEAELSQLSVVPDLGAAPDVSEDRPGPAGPVGPDQAEQNQPGHDQLGQDQLGQDDVEQEESSDE